MNRVTQVYMYITIQKHFLFVVMHHLVELLFMLVTSSLQAEFYNVYK